MPSTYLIDSDLAAYGVPNATPQQVQAASAAVDAYLGRPEGMVWTPDFNGAPAYMAAPTPMMTLTASGSIAAGQNVVVPVTGGYLSPDTLGEVLILDRGTPNKTEACVVSAVGPSSVTLLSVATSHTGPVTLEAGLVLMEERALPANRSVTRVSRTPVARLISGVGRYAFGRRSEQFAGSYADMNLLATMQAFGAPVWTPFNVSDASVSAGTGDVWVPPGMAVAYFSDVRLRYVAGYPTAGLPSPIKQAVASLITTQGNFPELSGNIKKVTAGKSSVERFADSVLDADTKALLEPYRTNLLF